ncbi:hypothetical protein LIER_32599 [Lithospermum erythrorhizon]|uniref:Uncharacterized protein n=1 Tax=Lithospermum erythrorhizon TaxID=34254 RepID=A0AAV3RZM9_LITER
MMAFKHLHELLKEDQEPFQLKSYISDKRYQLKRPNNPSNTLQIKKNITIVTKKSSLATKHSFCKNACFLSFQNSPDVRKSPFFDFPSPSKKSPLIRNGAVLLHVPAKTAALLFEAALRVQSQRNSKEKRGVGFGILGSILKKFKERNTNKQSSRHIPVVTTLRNRNKKKQIGKNVIEVEEKCVEQERRIVSGYCNNSRLSSAGWSESNEEKSLDLESSCSEESEDYSLEEAFAAYEKRFCSSPLSSFRFSLRRSPSGHRTPELSSPAASPRGQNGKKQEQTEGSNIVLEDEKEQCSPVSVLDTPYEAYDDDGLECGDEEEYEDNDYYVEDYNESNGSYAIVQGK